MQNPKTTAKIGDHPIHPMLIPFPVAFLVATLVCDLIFRKAHQGSRPGAMGLAETAELGGAPRDEGNPGARPKSAAGGDSRSRWRERFSPL